MKVKALDMYLIVVSSFAPSSGVLAETYTELKPIIDANCARCHNADGIADFLPFESFADVKPVVKKMADALRTGKMPKDNTGFNATPDGQRLLNWLTTGEDLFPPPQQGDTYVTMKPLVDTHCKSCHNADGIADFLPFETFNDVKSSVNKMTEALKSGKMPKNNPTFNATPEGKRLLNWLTTGSDLHGQPPPVPVPQHPILKDPRELTYEEMKPIIRQNCVGCHNPRGQMPRYPFETFDQVSEKSKAMLKQLSRTRMPMGNPEFRFTQDGRALMGWLEFGRDLNGD